MGRVGGRAVNKFEGNSVSDLALCSVPLLPPAVLPSFPFLLCCTIQYDDADIRNHSLIPIILTLRVVSSCINSDQIWAGSRH